MALTQAQIKQALRDYIAEVHAPDGSSACTVNRADLNAAAVAIDAWIDANQASFNAALPVPFRTTSSAAQKSALFMWVLVRRFRG